MAEWTWLSVLGWDERGCLESLPRLPFNDELGAELNVFFPNLLFARVFYHSSRDKTRTVSKKELCRKSVVKRHTGLRTGEGQVSRAFLRTMCPLPF